VRVVQPEVIQSLPPITIDKISDGPDPWIAFTVAIGVSVAAVVIASITLRKVNEQIGIANQQLGVASEKLAAVRNDFDLAQPALTEVTRRPKISVSLNVDRYVDKYAADTTPWFVSTMSVSNGGERLAQKVMLELLVPEGNYLNDSLSGPLPSSLCWLMASLTRSLI
jgi:hypothetical protein